MENFYEHIDDYKNGLLTGETLDQFELAMQTDASLRLAVDNYDAAKSISEGLLEIDMLQTLQNIGKPENQTINAQNSNNRTTPKNNHLIQKNDRSVNSSTKPIVSIFNLRNLMAAASVIGVLFFAGWWMVESNTDLERKEYILAQIDKIRPVDLDATKSIDTLGMTAFEKGKYYYSLNRYEESIQWLERMTKIENDLELLSEGYYWLGHAYMQEWRVEDAKIAWEKSNKINVKNALEIILN